MARPRTQGLPIKDRLLALSTEVPGGCWEWTARIDPKGYGRVFINGAVVPAHRAAYLALIGPIPEGMVIDHLCRNRKCINPDHLEPVTPHENWRRGENFTALNLRVTHCPSGHEYGGENLRITRRGGRECRACNRASVARYKTRKTAKQKAVG